MLIRKLRQLSPYTLLLLAVVMFTMPSLLGKMFPSQAGKLLVAGTDMPPPFDKTVIYIRHHNFAGAIGIVLNKPLPDEPRMDGEVVFYGGPVDPDKPVQHQNFFDVYRPYKGHAGWAPMQLDLEWRAGHWYVIDADTEVMRAPPEEMWERAIGKVPLSDRNKSKSTRLKAT